jgi:hypothetical protein
MLASDETAMPSATQERMLLHRVVGALADGPVVDLAALAGDQPVADRLATALREQATERAVIVCAGVLERADDFIEIVELLVALSTERSATVVLSVSDDSFCEDAAAAPRRSVWGEGAVHELRRLLPDGHVVLHEVALRGAALVAAGQDAALPVTVDIDPRATVPVSYVLAFGPRAAELTPAAIAVAADLRAERARDRERTAELEVLRARVRDGTPVAEISPPDETGSPR